MGGASDRCILGAAEGAEFLVRTFWQQKLIDWLIDVSVLVVCVLLPENVALVAPPPQVKELQAVMAAAAEHLPLVGAEGQRRHLLLTGQFQHAAHCPARPQTPGSSDQSHWVEGLEPAGEGLPAIPDSDGAVVVAADDVALAADQVAAGRGHLHHLHTCGVKGSEVSQRSGSQTEDS